MLHRFADLVVQAQVVQVNSELDYDKPDCTSLVLVFHSCTTRSLRYTRAHALMAARHQSQSQSNLLVGIRPPSHTAYALGASVPTELTTLSAMLV